jgi:membrane protein insertase, YidC/Oxa1 family, C-terminal domain
MDVFGFLIAEFLYRPVYNILVAFLEVFEGNLGRAIVGLTLVVRLLLLNISLRGTKAQKGFHDLQPKIHEVQEKYKDDPEKQSAELMKVFKKEGAGPLKGCLGMLLQIPVFIGLFFVIRRIASNEVPIEWLYSFMQFGEKFFNQDFLEMTRLGMDLLATENAVLRSS